MMMGRRLSRVFGAMGAGKCSRRRADAVLSGGEVIALMLSLVSAGRLSMARACVK